MLMRAQDRQQEQNTLLAALTPREREILACLADGAGRRDVAERLYLSANTVRTHLRNLMAKLGVHSTLEAVAMVRGGELSDRPPVGLSFQESRGGHGRCRGPVRVRRRARRRTVAGHLVEQARHRPPGLRDDPGDPRHDGRRLGGATRSGGWYSGVSLADQRQWVNKKVVSGADQKRLVPPPATWEGVPVFVEVDDVEAVWMVDNGGVPGTDQDTSANVCMVGQPRSSLTCIHIEIDGRWKARGWAPPDFPMRVPIDIQGYVYWDNPHESEGDPEDSAPSNYILGHYETGWEVDPVSAWRLHRG